MIKYEIFSNLNHLPKPCLNAGYKFRINEERVRITYSVQSRVISIKLDDSRASSQRTMYHGRIPRLTRNDAKI